MKKSGLLKANEQLGGVMTQPVQVTATAGLVPEFGRWRDIERMFGIKRGVLYKLIGANKIKTVLLSEGGHGCRLICVASVREYLQVLMAQQNPEPKA